MGRILILIISVLVGSTLSQAEAQVGKTLSISNPIDQTRFLPGALVNITVTGDSNVIYRAIMVSAKVPIESSAVRENVRLPVSFTLKIPQNIKSGGYDIWADAVIGNGARIKSSSVKLIIAPEGGVSAVKVEPALVRFSFVGENIFLSALGKYSDGFFHSISGLPGISFRSESTDVASISKNGLLVANGPGSTNIIFSYGGIEVAVAVDVEVSALRGDINGDGVIDQSDINLLASFLNTVPKVDNDGRDLNGDKKINALDLRVLSTLCTRPRCATN